MLLFILGLLISGQAHGSPIYQTGEEVEMCEQPDQIVSSSTFFWFSIFFKLWRSMAV